MTVDIGEVLTRAWQITWKYKVLWLYGFVMMLLSFMLMPLALFPAFGPLLSVRLGDRFLDEPVFLLLFFGAFGLFMIVLYPISALLNTALAVGVLHGERGEEHLAFWDLIRESALYFWRILGIMLLFVGGMLLVMFFLYILLALISVVTFGLGMLCMMPFTLLQYPIMLVWYICMEQSMAGVIVDGLGVLEAAQRSWQLFRKHIWTFVLFGLVLYFGLSMLSGFMAMPMMLPLFFIPVASESAEFGRIILVISAVVMFIAAPIFALVQGGVLALMRSGWIVIYLSLTRPSPEPQPILQEIPA